MRRRLSALQHSLSLSLGYKYGDETTSDFFQCNYYNEEPNESVSLNSFFLVRLVHIFEVISWGGRGGGSAVFVLLPFRAFECS